MSRLWMIRHGPTHMKSFVGWTDVPADLSAIDTLNRLSMALPDAPVISSDLVRAQATASAIADDRVRLPDDPRLRETHFGDWEGLTWAEIEGRDAALSRAVFETPGDAAPPGGESWNAFAARVNAAVDAITGEAIVVCHFGTILTQVQRALGCSAYDALSHRIDPLSLTVIDRAPWGATLINHGFE